MTTTGYAWATLVGSLAVLALILMACGLMLGIVKPADALKKLGAFPGHRNRADVDPECSYESLVGHALMAMG